MKAKSIIFSIDNQGGGYEVPKIYYPVPASKIVPDWYKNIESTFPPVDEKKPSLVSEFQTIKKCMPVFDMITAGYIIKLYTDLEITKNNEGIYEYKWAFGPPKTISFHNQNQIYNYLDKPRTEHAPKLANPWSIQTPEGYSSLFLNPAHRPPSGIRILEGLVDTDDYVNSVQFPFLVDDGFEGVVPAGTPIVQVIPFKRDDFEMSIGDNGKLAQEVGAQTRSVFTKGYKTFFRKTKSYR